MFIAETGQNDIFAPAERNVLSAWTHIPLLRTAILLGKLDSINIWSLRDESRLSDRKADSYLLREL
jgi:hypothetical protein